MKEQLTDIEQLELDLDYIQECAYQKQEQKERNCELNGNCIINR